MSFKFEKLKVWQKAVDLSADVNDLTKTFPKEEYLYILTDKTGCRFRIIGYGRRLNRSNIEVVSCLYLGRRRNLIALETFIKIYNKYEVILVMINALRNSLI